MGEHSNYRIYAEAIAGRNQMVAYAALVVVSFMSLLGVTDGKAKALIQWACVALYYIMLGAMFVFFQLSDSAAIYR